MFFFGRNENRAKKKKHVNEPVRQNSSHWICSLICGHFVTEREELSILMIDIYSFVGKDSAELLIYWFKSLLIQGLGVQGVVLIGDWQLYLYALLFKSISEWDCPLDSLAQNEQGLKKEIQNLSHKSRYQSPQLWHADRRFNVTVSIELSSYVLLW